MPGMGGAPQNGNSVVVSAFHNELFHQFLLVLVIGAVCAIAFNVIRTVQYRRLRALGGHTPVAAPPRRPKRSRGGSCASASVACGSSTDSCNCSPPCPWGCRRAWSSPRPPGRRSGSSTSSRPGRHLVQPSDPGGVVGGVDPAGSRSLAHPGPPWPLVALGGAATVGWGLVVWIFGEAFGGIFAPGATWLFGAPGAALIYCVGGLLVALPERAFLTPRLGRIVWTLGGVFLIGMSVLQAWPGRGFWQGRGGHPAVAGRMPDGADVAARVPVVGGVVRLLRLRPRLGGEPFRRRGAGRHRACSCSRPSPGRPRCHRRSSCSCLADWVLVQDFGFLRGVGTDPNTMLPMACSDRRRLPGAVGARSPADGRGPGRPP